MQLLENTLVIFSSDNGPWLVMEEHGGQAGILREGKNYTFEGGQRVPTIAMWPAKIPAGQVCDDMAVMMDWFPTICNIAGAEIPGDRAYDGVDISPVLLGEEPERNGPGFLYFDLAEMQCYREGDWKVKLPFEGFHGSPYKKAVAPHGMYLFNLREDPGETRNLAAAMPGKLDEMLQKMDRARDALGDLPPSLVVMTDNDNRHFDFLEEKHGDTEYWHLEW
jgi:arylsulfatase A-like enzyme